MRWVSYLIAIRRLDVFLFRCVYIMFETAVVVVPYLNMRINTLSLLRLAGGTCILIISFRSFAITKTPLIVLNLGHFHCHVVCRNCSLHHDPAFNTCLQPEVSSIVPSCGVRAPFHRVYCMNYLSRGGYLRLRWKSCSFKRYLDSLVVCCLVFLIILQHIIHSVRVNASSNRTSYFSLLQLLAHSVNYSSFLLQDPRVVLEAADAARMQGKRDLTSMLNHDCLRIIFGMLTRADLCQARVTCRRWHAVGGDQTLWRHVSLSNIHVRVWPVMRQQMARMAVHTLDMRQLDNLIFSTNESSTAWMMMQENGLVSLLGIPTLSRLYLPPLEIATVEKIAALRPTLPCLHVSLHVRGDGCADTAPRCSVIDFGRLRGLSKLTSLAISAPNGITLSAFSFR